MTIKLSFDNSLGIWLKFLIFVGDLSLTIPKQLKVFVNSFQIVLFARKTSHVEHPFLLTVASTSGNTFLELSYINNSGQIIIIYQPRFPWNKGISLAKPPFGVRSCEVAIIWPEQFQGRLVFFVVFDFQGNYICTIHGSYGNGKGLVRVYSQQFQRTIFLVGLTSRVSSKSWIFDANK